MVKKTVNTDSTGSTLLSSKQNTGAIYWKKYVQIANDGVFKLARYRLLRKNRIDGNQTFKLQL